MQDGSAELAHNAERLDLMEYSGSEYEGTYEAGRFSGNGTYTYPDGESRPRAL